LQACCDFLHIQRPWKVRQRALHQLRIFFKSIAHIRKDVRRMSDRKGDGDPDWVAGAWSMTGSENREACEIVKLSTI